MLTQATNKLNDTQPVSAKNEEIVESVFKACPHCCGRVCVCSQSTAMPLTAGRSLNTGLWGCRQCNACGWWRRCCWGCGYYELLCYCVSEIEVVCPHRVAIVALMETFDCLTQPRKMFPERGRSAPTYYMYPQARFKSISVTGCGQFQELLAT